MELAEKLTKDIYIDCPKVWEKLEEKYNNKQVTKYCGINIYFDSDDCIKFIDYRENMYIVPFSMIYGLFIDFFAEYGKNLIKKTIDLYDSVGFDKEGINRVQYKAILNLCELLDQDLSK